MSIKCTKAFSVVVRDPTPCNISGILVTPVNVRIVGYANTMFAGIHPTSCGNSDAWSAAGSIDDWLGQFGPSTEASGLPIYYHIHTGLYSRTNATDGKIISAGILYDKTFAGYGNPTGCGWVLDVYMLMVGGSPNVVLVWKGQKGYGVDPIGTFARASSCPGFGPASIDIEAY